VHVGKIAPLGPGNVPSGFVKHPVHGAVAVHPLGLDGDEQADPTVHGGPDKAVYGYAARHHATWAAEHPGLAELFVPGGVGENLAIDGMDESDLCVGDIHHIGTALLQVCQPRQPCFKFALRFADNRLPKAMVRNGRAGWYYRVVRPGEVAAGDVVRLHARPNPDFGFARLVQLVNDGSGTRAEMTRLAEMEGVALNLRATARNSLAPPDATPAERTPR
jgi:MOSC domain-containing protein YiiM